MSFIYLQINKHNEHYTDFLEIVPDEAIPVLFDTEIMEVKSTSPEDFSDQNLSIGDQSTVNHDLSGDLKIVDTSDRVHVVPHLEGMDLSEDEEDNKNLHLFNKRLKAWSNQMKTCAGDEKQCRVKGLKEELVDDMFASHLQQIEEDENDYNLCDRSSDLFISPSCSSQGSAVQTITGHRSLFTPLQLLMEAGLSPQYVKAGCNNLCRS